jgi:hypothetical protein
VHEDLIQKEVARRYLQIVNNFDKSPYGGVYWIINVYGVDRALLENSGPLTTYETYMFDVQPKGVTDAKFCSTSPNGAANTAYKAWPAPAAMMAADPAPTPRSTYRAT